MATASDINPLVSWGFNRKRQMMRNAFNTNSGTAAPLINKIMYGALGPFIKMWTGSIWDRIALWSQDNEFSGTNKFGTSTDYLQIDNSGLLSLHGDATVWDDLRIEPVPRSSGAKAPSFISWKGGLYLYDFNDAVLASEKEIFFTVQMPHTWATGTAVEPHVHWVNKTAGTAGQVIRWGLEYSFANIGETFSTPNTIYATTIAGGGDITVPDEHMITEFASIDMTGKGISTVLVCRIFRNSSDAADTYGGTAGLLYLDWHYQVNSMGSQSEYTK